MTRKLFVTGATGVLGRPAVRGLVGAGHEVRAVRAERVEGRAAPGCGRRAGRRRSLRRRRGQGRDRGRRRDPAPRDAHPGDARTCARRDGWSEHNRLRTEATRNLLEAASTHAIGTFLKESITFVYPDHGDDWIDEHVPPDESNVSLRPTLEGERLVEGFVAGGGRGIVLRFGSFYGPDARAVDDYLKLARRRSAPSRGTRPRTTRPSTPTTPRRRSWRPSTCPRGPTTSSTTCR